MNKQGLLIAIVTAGLSGLMAGSIEAQRTRIIEARTLCFQRVADIPEIFIAGASDPHKILLPMESFSNTFKCKVTDGVAVFFKQEGQNEDGSPRRKVVARVKISGKMRKVLFYFVPARGGKMLYHVKAMDDGLRGLPLGHTRLVNLSKKDVAFRLGGQVRQLKPNATSQIGEVKERDAWNMASVVCRMKTSAGKWRTICETKSKFTRRKRLLIVSYQDEVTRQPQVRVYKDIPLAPPPALRGL